MQPDETAEDTLPAFLDARLAEDEAAAWSVHDVAKCDALLYEEDMASAAALTPACDCGYPARALREIAAKRALITFAFANAAAIDGEWGDGHEAAEIEAGQCNDHGGRSAMNVLRPLATVYSDHPDYRQEWAPVTR